MIEKIKELGLNTLADGRVLCGRRVAQLAEQGPPSLNTLADGRVLCGDGLVYCGTTVVIVSIPSQMGGFFAATLVQIEQMKLQYVSIPSQMGGFFAGAKPSTMP